MTNTSTEEEKEYSEKVLIDTAHKAGGPLYYDDIKKIHGAIELSFIKRFLLNLSTTTEKKTSEKKIAEKRKTFTTVLRHICKNQSGGISRFSIPEYQDRKDRARFPQYITNISFYLLKHIKPLKALQDLIPKYPHFKLLLWSDKTVHMNKKKAKTDEIHARFLVMLEEPFDHFKFEKLDDQKIKLILIQTLYAIVCMMENKIYYNTELQKNQNLFDNNFLTIQKLTTGIKLEYLPQYTTTKALVLLNKYDMQVQINTDEKSYVKNILKKLRELPLFRNKMSIEFREIETYINTLESDNNIHHSLKDFIRNLIKPSDDE